MSVLQTVRYHVERGLSGVLHWQHFVVRNFTSQMAVMDITTPKGHKYELVARSPAEAPPLGQVVLRVVLGKDMTEDVIEGQNQDRTWLQVCEFLKAKETGASSDNAAALARAVDDTPQQSIEQLAPDEIENPIPPLPLVYFISQKGEFYRNGWALVTSAHRDGTLDLTVFARNHESYHVEKVAVRTDTLRYHCYVDAVSIRPTRNGLRAMIVEEVAAALTAPAPNLVLDAAAVQLMIDDAIAKLQQQALIVPVDGLSVAETDELIRSGRPGAIVNVNHGAQGDVGPVVPLAPAEIDGIVVNAAAALGEKTGIDQRLIGVIGVPSSPATAETNSDPTNPNAELSSLIGSTDGMSAEDIAALKELAREQGADALAALEQQLAGSASTEANKT